VLVLGGGTLAAELGRQIRTRADLALTCVGFLGEDETAALVGPRLGTYGDVAAAVARCRPDRIIVAMPDPRNHLPLADLLACRVRGIVVEEGTQAFERLTRRLVSQSLSREFPQLVVHEREQLVCRLRIARFDSIKNLSNVRHTGQPTRCAHRCHDFLEGLALARASDFVKQLLADCNPVALATK